jgi:hypothetical protein
MAEQVQFLEAVPQRLWIPLRFNYVHQIPMKMRQCSYAVAVRRDCPCSLQHHQLSAPALARALGADRLMKPEERANAWTYPV